jgi:hypothetical protein
MPEIWYLSKVLNMIDQPEELKVAIQRLESTIKKKTEELRLSDRASAAKLKNLKKDKWVNIQLNLRVLREQLLRKLRARKFELATLDRANSSRILDQKTKAHVEKAVKSRSGGIEATVKKYNARLKELAGLRGKGGIRKDAYIPPVLSMEGLYRLDVDQDIWEDVQGNIADFPDGVVPPWLADSSVKEGIRLAQEIGSCHQELERCKAEHGNLRTWFCEEYSAVMDVFMGSDDEDVSYWALLRANQLYDWMMGWKRDIVQVPIIPDVLSWDNIRMPLSPKTHHIVRAAVQAQMDMNPTTPDPESNLGDSHRQRVLDDSDASSDDSEDGELEEFFEPQEASFIAAIDQFHIE